MTDLDVLKAGYKEYPKTCFDHPSVLRCFQKRFDDDVGKRYFIDIKKWEGCIHPHTGKSVDAEYEYDTQMYKKGSHDAVDILFHSSWKLEDVEDYLKKLFNTGLFDYYEKWEPQDDDDDEEID